MLQNSTPLFVVIITSFFATVLTLLFVVLLVKISGPIPISLQQTMLEKPLSFEVTGEGSTEVVPDEAVAVFGVVANEQSVPAVQEAINSKIKKVKDSLRQLGISEEDIKTINYNINPTYSYEGGTSRISGYSASYNLEITFKDFKILNQAIDRTTSSGANIVGSLRFTLSEKAKKDAQDEARRKAVASAKDKASKIAQAAGVKLGRIINIKEEESPEIMPIGAFKTLTESAAEKTPTEVSPGTSTVKVRIAVSFEIK
jgi:uncharacterized protein YggE